MKSSKVIGFGSTSERLFFSLILGASLSRPLVAGLVALTMVGCAGVSITPGKVYGNISYTNISPDVVNYLNSSPVVPNPGSVPELEPVRTYKPGEVVAIATSQYTPDNSITDPQTFQGGHYEIYPNAETGGTNLLLTIDQMRFGNNASYRFGSIAPLSLAARQCNGVTPMETNSAGTQCDIGECPALLDLHLHFTGAQPDLDAIDPTASIPCETHAFVEDIPGSGDYALQATSGSRLFTLAELLAGSAQIKFLTRGVNSQVRVKLACSVKIKPGETGFVVIPASGLTPLSSESTIYSVACGQTVTAAPIDIPVERHAGRLTGYFDVSGYDEVAGEVCVDNFYSPFCTSTSSVVADATPTQKWAFEGILAGPHAVLARAIVDGDHVLAFPQKSGANLPVQVVEGATADLGATFVSRPVTGRGQLKLFDPGGQTDLGNFVAPPFTGIDPYFSSYVSANGDTLTAPNGTSGIGAYSKGRLPGNYDPSQDLAQLNYTLYLNGLSSPDGNLDGSNARPVPWDVDSLTLFLNPTTSGGTERLSVGFGMALHYPNLTGDAIEVPEQRICFGRITVEFDVSPRIGSISGSYSYGNYPIGDYSPSTTGVTPIDSVSAYAWGMPDMAGAQRASVSLTLPEGFQYWSSSFLTFIPVGGSTSQASNIYLNPIKIPSVGALGCGEDSHECINLQDNAGNFTQLGIKVTDSAGGVQALPYCRPNGNMNLRVAVESQGINVARVAYQFDPPASDTCLTGPARELCATGCGPNPSFPVSLTGVTPGQHTLTACATSDIGCNAKDSYTFYVDTQTPALTCKPDFTVTLTGSVSSILATDPRVSANLGAQVLGNCGLPTAISDDRPAEFLIGQTPVTFTSSGIGSCTTNVTVKVVDRVISFITDVGSSARIQTRSFLDTTVNRIEHSSSQPYRFEYSDDGTRLAIIPLGSGDVEIKDTVTGQIVEIFAVPTGYTLHDIAFDPQSPSRYAIVGTEMATPDQHAIFIYLGSVPMSRFDMPLFVPSLRISQPKIAWSPDGSKISASFTQPAPAISSYSTHVSEWTVVSNEITLPPVSGPSEIRPGLSNRETIRELACQDDHWRAIASDLTVSLGFTLPGSATISAKFGVKNVDMDLPPDGKSAAFIQHIDLPGGDAARLGFVTSLSAATIPRATYGPTYFPLIYTPSAAISSDAQYVAVGLDDKIIVYSTSDLNHAVFTIEGLTKPRNLEFKPFK